MIRKTLTALLFVAAWSAAASTLTLVWNHQDTADVLQGKSNPNPATSFKLYQTGDATNTVTILPSVKNFGTRTNRDGSLSTNVFWFTFTNILPGKYTFHLTAVNDWGLESDPSSSASTGGTNKLAAPGYDSIVIVTP